MAECHCHSALRAIAEILDDGDYAELKVEMIQDVVDSSDKA